MRTGMEGQEGWLRGFDGQCKEKSNGSLLGWMPSSHGDDKYYQDLDLATLISYMLGLPNLQTQRYINLAQELLDKEAKRALLSVAQSAFASVNDRGRNSA